MYLKKIEMQGFKSFADKTEINFEDSITAVVGPNGSGKSNVSDAIRWVLGEQSAKSLRGGKMEDIIFSGTDGRRALGFAEVSIYFDNSMQTIPLDYNEVVITRRMFRSGDSEFYINKTACRLKDIRQLFMDTGIGRDGYSIIGQGRIEEILSDRPEDRRNIFEEAAGIVKYKSKKEETERKLEKTQDNLDRISDLTHEISKQNDSLEEEARKAIAYKKYYEELKFLDINIAIREIDSLNKNIKNIENAINEINKNISLVNDERNNKENIFNELQGEIRKIDLKIDEIRNEKFEIVKGIEKDKNSISIYEEKENHHNKDIDRLNLEISNLKSNKEILEKTILDLEDNKLKLIETKDLEIEELKEKEEELEKLTKELRVWNIKLSELKDSGIELYNESSDFKNRLNSIDSFNQNMDLRLNQLEKELKELDEKELEINTNLKKSKKEEEEVKKQYNSNIELVKNKGKELEDLKSDFNTNLEKAKNLQINIQGNISSYNLYKNMEEGYEGYYKSVKNLLSSIDKEQVDSKGFIGVVADLIKVNKTYERAIDITLGSNIQNIVTETEEDAKRMINFLKSRNMGRVTFLPVTSVKGTPLNIDIQELKEFGVLGLASDLVEYDKKYEALFMYLLGRTVIVDNIDNALKIARRFNHRYRIVTLDGDILNPGGSLTGGSYSKNIISLISRKNKIKELNSVILKEKEMLKNYEGNHNSLKITIEKNEANLKDIVEETKQLEIKIMEVNNEIKSYEYELERLHKESNKNKEDLNHLKSEITKFSGNKYEFHEGLEKLENKLKVNKEEVEKLSKLIEEKNLYRSDLLDAITGLKISRNNNENRLVGIDIDISNRREEIGKTLANIEEKENLIKNNYGGLNSIKEEYESLKKEIVGKEESEKEISKKLQEELDNKEKIMLRFYEEQDNLKKLNEKLNDLEREKNKQDLELSKNKISLENTTGKLLDEYDLNYDNGLEFVDSDLDMDKVGPRLKELKKEIRKLGNINLDSVVDYEEVNKRLKFLLDQEKDLVDSKEKLEEIIDDIEIEMKDKFIKAFDVINANFEEVFKELFNGGEASLELEKDKDILDAGIDINVQPPGKKLQSIRLLSGGEKSLTAVALLFAILKMKPSPFCILDEIDAALDDANIGRYTDYLMSLNETTQFILITHRKTTMEISNTLYGVTMAEEGVSRLYSVKMKDYTEEELDRVIN